MTAVPLAAAQSPGEIARASGSNFLVSFLFLSPGRRRGLLAVYAFCRVVDDAVDRAAPLTDDGTRDEGAIRRARQELDYWEAELDAAFAGKPRTPLGFALHQAARRFDLEREPLLEVCRGCRMDLDARRYSNFDELRGYMHRVASCVGIACLPIFGADRARSREYAERLGLALQYTNILRDLAEDGDEGRVYVPLDRLEAHGVDQDWLCSAPPPDALLPDGPLARFLNEQHDRAERLFADAAAALPAADKRSLRSARIMGRIYHELLGRVRKLGPSVLVSPRVRVPYWRRGLLALACLKP